mgnify:CR=1 FL=1
MTTALAPLRWLRIVRARPRLLIAVATGVAFGLLCPEHLAARPITRWIGAWNVGAFSYLAMVAAMVRGTGQADVRRHARHQDDGANIILGLVAMAALASLGAIVAELAVAKDLNGSDRLLHIALAVATIVSSWAFTQVMFALHYAHDYYVSESRHEPPGLAFPDTPQPGYLDFLYFSVVIGTSGQTADVSFTTTRMRRIGLVHCTLAFVFNTSLVGLMINVASSLL